ADAVRERLQWGLFPAVPVPFTRDGEIHAPSQARHVEYIGASDAAGVAVWVHTGRGTMLTSEQRSGVMRAWRDGLPAGKLIVAGAGPAMRNADDAGADDFDTLCAEATSMATEAKDAGADALLCFPPFGLKAHRDRRKLLLEYHGRLSRVGLPLILFYLHEGGVGIAYTLDELRDMFSLDGVVAIKMATLEGILINQAVSRMIREEFPQQVMITGEDRFLGYSIILGATAALIGMGCACTNFQNDLLQAMRGGEGEKFLDLCRRVDALGEATFCFPLEGYIQRMMWVLADAGIFDADATYDPWGPVLNKDAELAFIRKVIEENEIPF
ncbi:MAG: dihydrodipicolinate synthase family protein, partial [Planctomycetia bacterium]|nr:dihydrodipicolinate synthase family protein [Planctomycetia bacterium]